MFFYFLDKMVELHAEIEGLGENLAHVLVVTMKCIILFTLSVLI